MGINQSEVDGFLVAGKNETLLKKQLQLSFVFEISGAPRSRGWLELEEISKETEKVAKFCWGEVAFCGVGSFLKKSNLEFCGFIYLFLYFLGIVKKATKNLSH